MSVETQSISGFYSYATFKNYQSVVKEVKKDLKIGSLFTKWICHFYPTEPNQIIAKQWALGYKFVYIPMFLLDSYGLDKGIYNKDLRTINKYSPKLVKDSYSLYRMLDKLKILKQVPWTHAIGGVLLLSKGIQGGFILQSSYYRFVEIGNTRVYSNLDYRINLEEEKVLMLKMVGAICWIASCVFTIISLVYIVEVAQIILYLGTVGFAASLLKDYYKSNIAFLNSSR